MNTGFLTNCLRDVDLADLMTWAGQNGFGALEIWSGGKDQGTPWTGSTLNPANINETTAGLVRDAAQSAGVAISCLTYCDNQLDPDEVARRAKSEHLLSIIDAASLLDVDVVSCFIGRNPARKIEDNFEDVKVVFDPIMARAAEKGVRIALENWPGLGWQFEGLVGNIAHSPVTWRRLFELFPEMGLNYDPSHLVWQGIDYLRPVKEFAARIYHVHAKDTEMMSDALADGGILPPARRCYRYRVPGCGVVDWPTFASTLKENGYDGPLSIEHEDPVYRGDEATTKAGLILGRKHLDMAIA